jgi:DNA-binding NarL/FixJ family response regulator
MKFTSLTPRERDVLRLVPTGMRNKQIAKKLGITEGTVKLYRGRGCVNLG